MDPRYDIAPLQGETIRVSRKLFLDHRHFHDRTAEVGATGVIFHWRRPGSNNGGAYELRDYQGHTPRLGTVSAEPHRVISALGFAEIVATDDTHVTLQTGIPVSPVDSDDDTPRVLAGGTYQVLGEFDPEASDWWTHRIRHQSDAGEIADYVTAF